jgi:glutathione S-transferase
MATAARPNITLWFLNSSRAVRIAWLLEELHLPYELVRADRAPNGLAPPEFRQKIPGALRKSPTLRDGDLVLQESGAIIEYLCETYDKQQRLLPGDTRERAKVLEWLSASEGTFLMHGIAVRNHCRILT